MTDSDPQPTKTSSSSRTIIIAVLAIVVIAGGAFVVYKLTNKKELGQPASSVAAKAKLAVIAGDRAAIVKLSTAQGATELEALKPAQLKGLTFGSCAPYLTKDVKTKVCTFTRPGGQLSVSLIQRGNTWAVDQASLGEAGLPPTSTTT